MVEPGLFGARVDVVAARVPVVVGDVAGGLEDLNERTRLGSPVRDGCDDLWSCLGPRLRP